MEASTGKEGILKNIRKALTQSVDQPFPGMEKINFAFENSGDDLFVSTKKTWLTRSDSSP